MSWEIFEAFWDQQFSVVGEPEAAPARQVAGLFMLKYMEGLSDEGLIKDWLRGPYYQYFCGEVHFQHKAPIDPTTLVK